MTVFRSTFHNARVSFPPERFGLAEGVNEIYRDGALVKEKRPFRAIQFENGFFKVDDSSKMAEMLRKHPGNKANSAMSNVPPTFWEELAADTDAIMRAEGVPMVTQSDFTLSADDEENLIYLDKAARNFAPPQVQNVCKRATEVMERFGIVGMKPPVPEMGIRRTKARIIELLGVLEDAQIWVSGDEQGGSNTDGG